MTIGILREVFLWCTIINFGFLMLWFMGFLLAHDLVCQAHKKMFRLSEDTVNTVHFSAMAFFKLCIILFNLVPYIALVIVG